MIIWKSTKKTFLNNVLNDIDEEDYVAEAAVNLLDSNIDDTYIDNSISEEPSGSQMIEYVITELPTAELFTPVSKRVR